MGAVCAGEKPVTATVTTNHKTIVGKFQRRTGVGRFDLKDLEVGTEYMYEQLVVDSECEKL